MTIFVLLLWYVALIILGEGYVNTQIQQTTYPALENYGRLMDAREGLQKDVQRKLTTIEQDRKVSSWTRQTKTRPLTSTDASWEIPTLKVARMDEAPRRVLPSVTADDGVPSLQEDLCGASAREAWADDAGESFPSKFVLSSKSRVLITGILNPVGMHLALALKSVCGVEVIAGVDPMFPNTVLNRMELLDRIKLLVTNVPKLIQPIVLPLIGLDPRKNLQKGPPKEQDILKVTGELNLLQHKPTHIIHLASYGEHLYRDDRSEALRNMQSPYGSAYHVPDMYRLRSSLLSMEQLLQSLGGVEPQSRPQLVYASFGQHGAHSSHVNMKTADEVMADVYFATHGVISTAVRLPNNVYGPLGFHGTPVFDMVERAVASWGHTDDASAARLAANLTTHFPHEQNTVYVRDVVEGLIAAMQHRPQRPAVLDFSASETRSLSSVANVILGTTEVVDGTATQNELAKNTHKLLHWSPTTSLREGLSRTVAWHLDRAFPFDKPIQVQTGAHPGKVNLTGSGDVYRKQLGIPTCAADDILCHTGNSFLPCSSECNSRKLCLPSVFDEVRDLLRLSVTTECDLILYTQSLGYDVHDLKLKATYKDDGSICNFAFVPRDSHLVRAAIEKVPDNRLSEFDVNLTPEDRLHPELVTQRKLDGLNGKILYKGWILVWVKDATTELPNHDMFMMKLNPGSFFSPDVKHALFVDEKFPVSPNTDDVMFLISQTHRPKLKERRVFRKEEDGQKHKYRLAAEPERRAITLVAPLKQYNHQDPTKNTAEEKHKLTVYEATKYMMVEVGEDFLSKEKPELKRQREFYERIPSFTNRVDLRSTNEPWYRFEMKHWIRSRWVVHDLKLEESRQLRCEWYQENVQWGNELDQLSFAHVMAKREIGRRIAHNEPDDHIKPVHIQHPELMTLTDAHEWHAIESEENRQAHVHAEEAFEILPRHLVETDDQRDEKALAEQMRLHHEGDKTSSKETPLFVRIMSERVMMLARLAWGEKHGKAVKKPHK